MISLLRAILVMLVILVLAWPYAAEAQSLRRSTVWDLKLGQPIAAQPGAQEFRAFACGSNGGAPRQQLTGWSDFTRCRAEPDGGPHGGVEPDIGNLSPLPPWIDAYFLGYDLPARVQKCREIVESLVPEFFLLSMGEE